MPTIIQTGENTFTTDNGRGTKLMLQYRPKIDRWLVGSDNAAARAWNRGGAGMRYFTSLEEVERHYKAWRGITALVA